MARCFSTRASVATVLTTHPCVSRCWRVKRCDTVTRIGIVNNTDVSGPDSRNDRLAIGSDTILWSSSANRIPQTPITIGSSDREITKPNTLLPIESWHKSFTGKSRIAITWSWLNKKCQTDDIYSWRHNGRYGNVIYEYQYESVMASSVHAHSVCSQYNTVWTCHIGQVCVCDWRHWKYTNCWHKTDNVPVNVSR